MTSRSLRGGPEGMERSQGRSTTSGDRADNRGRGHPDAERLKEFSRDVVTHRRSRSANEIGRGAVVGLSCPCVRPRDTLCPRAVYGWLYLWRVLGGTLHWCSSALEFGGSCLCEAHMPPQLSHSVPAWSWRERISFRLSRCFLASVWSLCACPESVFPAEP